MTRKNRGRNVKETKTLKLGTAAGAEMHEGAKAPAVTPPKPDIKPVIIKVLKKDAQYGGAREAWYKRLIEHDGKTVDEYVQSCKDNCPKLTKSGVKENPIGWVGFFKRQGIMQELPGA